MGIVIRIGFGYKWEETYFVQCMNEELAKEKAFNMFKETHSCYLPNTIEEADKDDNFYIEVVGKVTQIIL